MTTFALAIGLAVVNITKPGAGLDVSAMAKGDVSSFATQGQAMTFADFLVHVVPESAVRAFADGDILQVVFFSVLFGTAALLLGVDRFMSEARAITNIIGNGVATMVIARSEGAFDDAAHARTLPGFIPVTEASASG